MSDTSPTTDEIVDYLLRELPEVMAAYRDRLRREWEAASGTAYVGLPKAPT